MLKSHSWMALLTLVCGSLIASEAGRSAPPESDYFCYRQSVTGEVQNLAAMCKKVEVQKATSANTESPRSRPPAEPARQPEAKSAASADRVRIADQARKRKLEFLDYSYDGKMLVGTVRNKTGKDVNDIMVVYQVEVREGEGKWRTVDNGAIATNNRRLTKNGKTNFSTDRMRSGDRITITDIEFD